MGNTMFSAAAHIHGGPEAPCLRGTVRFFQRRERVLVVARIAGLPGDNPAGFFAMHIHEGTACTGPGFADAGSHYNPRGGPHPTHAGDLPPLLSCGGQAYLACWTNRFRVAQILGRTLVIHGRADDFTSQPGGNAGERIGCGVICRVHR